MRLNCQRNGPQEYFLYLRGAYTVHPLGPAECELIDSSAHLGCQKVKAQFVIEDDDTEETKIAAKIGKTHGNLLSLPARKQKTAAVSRCGIGLRIDAGKTSRENVPFQDCTDNIKNTQAKFFTGEKYRRRFFTIAPAEDRHGTADGQGFHSWCTMDGNFSSLQEEFQRPQCLPADGPGAAGRSSVLIVAHWMAGAYRGTPSR